MVDLWQCSKCGRRFARDGQKHVCQRVTVREHLAGRPRRVVALYRAFEKLVATCGPFYHDPIKAQIGFQGTAHIFAGVRPEDDGLAGYLDLPRRVDESRFTRISPYTKRLFVHHFRITSPDQLADRFAAHVREAHAVGTSSAARTNDRLQRPALACAATANEGDVTRALVGVPRPPRRCRER